MSSSILHHHKLLHQFSLPCHHLTVFLRIHNPTQLRLDSRFDSGSFRLRLVPTPARYLLWMAEQRQGLSMRTWTRWRRMDLRSDGGGDERMYHHLLQPLMCWIDPKNKTNKIRFELIERETDPALLSCLPPAMAWRICFDWNKVEGDDWGRRK